MRVSIALLALVAAPFVAAAAQDRAESVQDAGRCAVPDAHRSPTSWSHERRPDPKGRLRTGCSPVRPGAEDPPPPPPPNGSVSITGTVYNDINGRPGLAGWVVELSGTMSATAVSDAQGNYQFAGLTAGSYTICEAVPSGWRQTFPPGGATCPVGFGYSFDLADGQSGSFINFGNVVQ